MKNSKRLPYRLKLFFSLCFLLMAFIYNISAQNYPVIKVETLKNFTANDSVRLNKELKLLQEQILNNSQFWEDVKNADYGCRNRRIYQNSRSRNCEFPKLDKDLNSYSNIEIHDLLFYGQDEIGQERDGMINLRLNLFEKDRAGNGNIIHGRTSSCNLTISSSRKTRLFASEGSYAKHILHEYMHILGFKHKSNKRKRNTRKCKGDDVSWAIQEIASKYL